MGKLSNEAHKILNDPARIQKRDWWTDRLQDLFNGGTKDDFPYVFTLRGDAFWPPDDNAFTEPEQWVIDALEMAAQRPECTANRFSPICVEYSIYGVHFIDKILGAHVFHHRGQWNADYLTTKIGTLREPDLEHDETWSLARRAAQGFLDADVALPLFGLPTLSSPLNIFVNLYGGEALVAMIEDEAAARHDLDVINRVICSLHEWYLKNLPMKMFRPVVSWDRTQPPGFGQLCGCTTQLLSGEMYEKFIAPLDDALLGVYPYGGMIHLCGSHTQHLPVFRKMPHLRAIQLNDLAADEFEQYFNGLREDQIIYLNPTGNMPVERALEISKGKRIVIVDGIDAPQKPKS